MKRSSTAVGLATLYIVFQVLAATPAVAALVEPPPLAVPDGASANKDEILGV